MMNNQFTIILPSKGRLREKSINIFKKKKLKILSDKGERDLVGYINLKKINTTVRILFLHARESIQALTNGTADICVSGIDLLKDSDLNIQKKIKVYKSLNFGHADLYICCPIHFLDCQTMLDVSEIASDFIKYKKQPLKIGTKYKRLVEKFLIEKNVKNVEIVESKGATEAMPRLSQVQLIGEIVSSGKTLFSNDLRPLKKDGLILKSSAACMVAKKSLKKKGIKKVLSLF